MSKDNKMTADWLERSGAEVFGLFIVEPTVYKLQENSTFDFGYFSGGLPEQLI
ncbi:hypothetical protein [Nitrosomonas aestuarii]|uniref:hypothetical protein n=1 Tax=Nitrosomonas aestuarii TaxID=52441 RepID=UPI000D413839|nr:hypothetical protein [Nitrosomonas aestuarii]PTN12526.1 hypothetical protein C8R11_10394 [Nitrosomonas aestuarii]